MDEQRRRLEREAIKNMDSPGNLRYLADHLERSGEDAKPRIFYVSCVILKYEPGVYHEWDCIQYKRIFTLSMRTAKQITIKLIKEIIEAECLIVPKCILEYEKEEDFNSTIYRVDKDFRKINNVTISDPQMSRYDLRARIDSTVVYTDGEIQDDMLFYCGC